MSDLHRIRRYGDFYFGINGVVTFKNAHVDDLLKPIGLNRILLETDCPYLAPVPNRGKRNDSGMLKYVVQELAALKGITPEEVIRITEENARRFYGIQ